MKQVVSLPSEETLRATLDAKLVAIRWDLIPWSMVFDLDVPTSEAKNAGIYRAWIVFKGMSQLTFPSHGARLPNGCCLTSILTCESRPDGFQDYAVTGILPIFDGNGLSDARQSARIVVCAQGIKGLRSESSAIPSEFGLPYATRIALASDAELQAMAEDS